MSEPKRRRVRGTGTVADLLNRIKSDLSDPSFKVDDRLHLIQAAATISTALAKLAGGEPRKQRSKREPASVADLLR